MLSSRNVPETSRDRQIESTYNSFYLLIPTSHSICSPLPSPLASKNPYDFAPKCEKAGAYVNIRWSRFLFKDSYRAKTEFFYNNIKVNTWVTIFKWLWNKSQSFKIHEAKLWKLRKQSRKHRGKDFNLSPRKSVQLDNNQLRQILTILTTSI